MKAQKLWQKDFTVNEKVEKFTIGDDHRFDLLLAPYDVIASKAHAQMLQAIGLISEQERNSLLQGLDFILEQIQTGNFLIADGVEDVHSQIEFMLTAYCGEAGKKIHTARSRNDQVLTAIKLFLKQEVAAVMHEVRELMTLFKRRAEEMKGIFLPGYTHFQVAMPSDFGLWLGAYADSLEEDLLLLDTAFRLCDKSPLGSAAGYGTSIPVDKDLTARLAGFSGINLNPVYAQMTRGKTEKQVSWALATVAATLSKFAYDCCLYLCSNFSFISFPDELSTGSSIMPHKKNPDVFELIRAKCNLIQAGPNQLTLLCCNLPHGYHRDMQLTKQVLFPHLQDLKACIGMSYLMLEQMQVNTGLEQNPMYTDVFSVNRVNDLVMQGVPFREAYRQVAKKPAE